uniref:CRAL-TRIO domain-containing protein n=1 Tax=Parastrongyloides trichosuri TaxID=131310 RepID=A0A0N4ZVY9_PARTI
LISWLAFNLWILRDYFFPCIFSPLYTETGLPKQKLENKKKEILSKKRVIDNVKVLPETNTIFIHDSIVSDQVFSTTNQSKKLKEDIYLSMDSNKINFDNNTNKNHQIETSIIIEA